MAETTITVTGTFVSPTDTAPAGTVVFQAVDQVDITNAKVSVQTPVTFNITGGVLQNFAGNAPGAVLLATPGGYHYTINVNGATYTPTGTINGSASIDFSSVQFGVPVQDASGIGVIAIEDIPAGGTYPTVLADANKMKRCNVGTDQTVNIDGSVNYPAGTTIQFLNWATGRIHLAGINGATLRQADNAFILRKQNSDASVIKQPTPANVWVVVGDVSAT